MKEKKENSKKLGEEKHEKEREENSKRKISEMKSQYHDGNGEILGKRRGKLRHNEERKKWLRREENPHEGETWNRNCLEESMKKNISKAYEIMASDA